MFGQKSNVSLVFDFMDSETDLEVTLIKGGRIQFFSVQVLEDVIWKLCTSGRPKLVWCKTN